ncbi:MAG: glucose-6-phosphate isomerase family protein [Planctomycetota bacterium]
MSRPRGFPVEAGLDLVATDNPLGFTVGPGQFAPTPEVRRLDDIRSSLRDPSCVGPRDLYAIMMDVGRREHLDDLRRRHLLFGVVTYAAGRLGDEPVRSQGHIHIGNPRDGQSTPEVYEVWRGRCVVLMQERCVAGRRDTGRCFAVEAGPGGVIVVPPGWAHATVSADPDQPLTFGAWCDRDYGFAYDDVRAHGGLAYFPLLDADGVLRWEPNPTYDADSLDRRSPRVYDDLGIEPDRPIYTQYADDPGRFDFVPDPGRVAEVWNGFTP